MVKRYGNLWEKVTSKENFELAYQRSIKGKRNKNAILKFAENLEENLEAVRQSLINKTFATGRYTVKRVFEPKQRDIYILPYNPDRIVQHALMNVLAPIWQAMFIKDSYGNIPGRGLHAGSRRIMDFTRKYPWCLKCDISKFYPSINHDIMFCIIKRKIKDRDVLWLLRDIIDSFPGDTNVPIGNYCSQWLGNLYLNELDRFVKTDLRIDAYIRYCDDFCLFFAGKAHARLARDRIEKFLTDKLHLCYSRSDIFPAARGVNFLGYKHFSDYILMRQSTLRRMKRLLRQPVKSQTIASIRGWLKHACTRNLRKNLFGGYRAYCRIV
ncbi:MAG: reverse transcriptase/maturase family protein [Alphaproteobacteria bacterium]|nr:reverse transcriptase/maturase family protein [Alphaproteobacteria bacterium]MCL2505757.1 reverse transcriptase/maturase family protein [Alphaproteobacteria bacterium]